MGLFEPYQVSADAVRGAAEQSTAGIESLRQLRADVDVEHRTALSAVEGDIRPYVESAPDASGTHSEAIVARLSFARGGAHMFAIAIDRFNTDSGDPRSVSKLNAAYEQAAADHFGVDAGEYTKDEGGLATIDKSRYSDAVTTAKEALIADLKAEYGRLDEQLDEDAAEVAAMLKGKDPSDKDVRAMFEAGALPSYAALLFPNVNLSGAKLARLPTDLRGMSDKQLAEYLVTNPGVYKVVGKNLATLVPGIAESIGNELAERLRRIEHSSDKTELDALGRALAVLSADSQVAIAFVKAIDVLKAVTRVGEVTNPEWGRELAQAIRSAVSRATIAMSDADARAFAEQVADEVRAAQTDLRHHEGVVALSFLLKDQQHGTAFLDVVGDRLDEMDRTQLGPWVPVDERNSGVLFFFDDRPKNANHLLDPIASYMSALGKNGEAALNFFTNGGDSNGAEDCDIGAKIRQEHYLKDRRYGDDFESLFAALERATVDDVNVLDPERAKLSAGLVASIAEYIPDRGLQGGGSDFSDQASVSLARILSGHMDSVAKVLLDPKAPFDGGFGDSYVHPDGDGRFIAVMETTELKSLIKLAVSTDDGLSAMRHGVSAYEQLALQRDIGANGELTAAAANNDARVEAFFTDCVGEQHLDEAIDHDKRRAAWINMGKSLVGMIPLPGAEKVGTMGAKAIGFLVDQSKTAVADEFVRAYASSAGVAEGTPAADKAVEDRQIAIASALYDPNSKDDSGRISNTDLRDAAKAQGFSDQETNRLFGTSKDPRLPSGAEIAAMSEGDRGRYLELLKLALRSDAPSFSEGTYHSTFITFQNR